MPASAVKYCAFFATYTGITNELTTPVSVSPVLTSDAASRGVLFDTEALWDTGATATCIKPALWGRLKLRPLKSGRTELSGIGGKTATELTFLNLFLTRELIIEDCPVYLTDFPGDAEILIGMDIISMGDFAVSNTGSITSFSFVIPSFPDRVNFADKADIANRDSKK